VIFVQRVFSSIWISIDVRRANNVALGFERNAKRNPPHTFAGLISGAVTQPGTSTVLPTISPGKTIPNPKPASPLDDPASTSMHPSTATGKTSDIM